MDDPRSEGWLIFAGIILMMAGAMRFFDAIWAWSYNGAAPSHLKSALFGQTLSNYGWVWIVVAIVLFGAGFGVMMRSQFSRWFGIVGRRDRRHQCHLVDAVLPGLVVDLRPPMRVGHLRPRRPWSKRTSVSATQGQLTGAASK